MTTPGQLNQRIAFQSRGPATGPDDGNTEGPFADRFDLAARRRFLRGSETVIGARLEGKQPVLFSVYASSLSRQITTDWQARDKRSGQVYAIKAVNPTEDGDWIDILAESGVAS